MALCPWITDEQWQGLQLLVKLPPFNKPSIIDHIQTNHAEWTRYIHESDEDEYPIIPGPYGGWDFEEARLQEACARRKAKQQAEQQNTEAKGAFDYDKIFAADNSDNEADENEEGERGEDAANTSSKKAQTRHNES